VDSEKFDKVVLDLLYDELDELTRASAVRHMDHSGRAKALYSELRATREVGELPLVEPPPDLARRILEAEEQVRKGRPLRQRIGAVVSIVAGYAMRPQLAMAALLLLMLGSSLLLLRVKPGEPNSLLVTERGVPESDRESVAIPVQRAPEPAAAPEESPARASRRAEPPRDQEPPPRKKELDTSGAGRGPATGAFTDPLEEGSGSLGTRARAPMPPGTKASAAMDVAENPIGLGARDDDAVREELKAGGCAGDLAHHLAIAENPPSREAGQDATWAVAQCNEKLGRFGLAREGYRSLLGAPAYSDRARAALDALPEPVAASRPAPTPPAAAAPSAPAGTGDKAGAKTGEPPKAPATEP